MFYVLFVSPASIAKTKYFRYFRRRLLASVVGELNDEYPAVKRSWSREGRLRRRPWRTLSRESESPNETYCLLALPDGGERIFADRTMNGDATSQKPNQAQKEGNDQNNGHLVLARNDDAGMNETSRIEGD